jgi:biofilm protein TabA
MILDLFQPLEQQGTEAHRRLRLGLDYLRALPADQPVGRVEIEGDGLFCMVQEYTTTPAPERKFESHRRYADIQAVLVGRESIYYSPLAQLQVTEAYEAERDCAIYTGADIQPVYLEPGNYAVFWPQDGHKPGCNWHGPEFVRKAVIKILLES